MESGVAGLAEFEIILEASGTLERRTVGASTHVRPAGAVTVQVESSTTCRANMGVVRSAAGSSGSASVVAGTRIFYAGTLLQGETVAAGSAYIVTVAVASVAKDAVGAAAYIHFAVVAVDVESGITGAANIGVVCGTGVSSCLVTVGASAYVGDGALVTGKCEEGGACVVVTVFEDPVHEVRDGGVY